MGQNSEQWTQTLVYVLLTPTVTYSIYRIPNAILPQKKIKKKYAFLITANSKTLVISIIYRNIIEDTEVTSSQDIYVF